MDAALQKRTALGLLIILIGHVVAFLLPQIASAVTRSLMHPSPDASQFPTVMRTLGISGAVSSVIIVTIWGIGAALLLPRLGGYAQAALAAFCVYVAFDLVRLPLSFGPTSANVSISTVAIRMGFFGLISSVLHALNSVAMLLLLRKASELAGARPSGVVTGIVIAASCWSLLRNMMSFLLIRTMAITAMVYFNYFGTFMYALLCGSFIWMAFKARKATLGMLLDPTVTAADAYRGATGLR